MGCVKSRQGKPQLARNNSNHDRTQQVQGSVPPPTQQPVAKANDSTLPPQQPMRQTNPQTKPNQEQNKQQNKDAKEDGQKISDRELVTDKKEINPQKEVKKQTMENDKKQSNIKESNRKESNIKDSSPYYKYEVYKGSLLDEDNERVWDESILEFGQSTLDQPSAQIKVSL